MTSPIKLPEEVNEWLTDDLRELLRRIRGRWARKKRATVIKLAFARANEQPLSEVFSEEDVCSETIWYQKWRHQELIAEAYEACYQRALEWMDDETARIEAYYRRQRRQSVARHAADAPAELASVMKEDEAGGNRIKAADTLMRWAEPETASKLHPTPESGGDQVVNQFLSGLSNEQLEQLLDLDTENGESGAAGEDTDSGAA